MTWAMYQRVRYPELELLYHVPNGGRRDKAEAAHLRRQGVKAGVPDLCLPVPRGGFHGLYIELKADKGKLTDHQQKWLSKLQGQGYMAKVCHGWQEAVATIETYLKG